MTHATGVSSHGDPAEALTEETSQGMCKRFCNDLVVAGRLHDLENVPVMPVQDVHESRPKSPKNTSMLSELFLLIVLFPVKRKSVTEYHFPSKFRLAIFGSCLILIYFP